MKNDKPKFPPAKQWEVYKFRTSPKETEGTEITKSRPGIIVSTNELNKWGTGSCW